MTAEPPPQPKRQSYLPEVHRALPQSIDAEKGVLGSVLFAYSIRGKDAGRELMSKLESQVSTSFFHLPAHKIVWRTIKQMHRDNEPLDFITLTEILESEGNLDQCGGAAAVTDLFTFLTTDANVQEYVTILKEKHGLRVIASLSETLTGESYAHGATPQQIAENAIASLQTIVTNGNSDSIASLGVEIQTFDRLFKYEAKEDTTTLLGDRWVCQGGQLLLVGQSGIGKSSITVQAALTWALGEPFMGINPVRPLKSLFVQAENDEGDMADIVQGVMSYVLASATKTRKFTKEQAMELMTSNITFARVTSQTGEDFANVVAKIIDKHGQRDLVFVDPLLSYIGDDINQQKVVSHFLRNLCNPIAFQRKFAWVFSHHTGKPASDSKSRKHWNEGDFAYIGLGSSELTNWARAIAVLQSTSHEGIYKLLLSKRGRRAGVIDANHQPTTVIPMKHADRGIYWEPCDLPEEDESDKKKGRPKAISTLQEAELIAFASAWPEGKGGLYSKAAEKFNINRETVRRFLTASKVDETDTHKND